MEILLLLVATFGVPVLLDQSKDLGHFAWVTPWLRELWMLVFTFMVCYVLWGTLLGREEMMRLYEHWKSSPSLGYLVSAVLGIAIFCGYWWFLGNIITSADSQKAPPPASSPSTQNTQTSSGANSPNISGSHNTVIYGNPKTDAKLDEITRLLKGLGGTDKLLAKYPLGYVVFDVDYVTDAVTPYETRKGLEAFQFDFRPVRITTNTATQIAIRLPDLIIDKKPVLTGGETGGAKRVGNLGGYMYQTNGVGIMAWGEILAIKGSQVTFLVGFQRAPVFKLPTTPHPAP